MTENCGETEKDEVSDFRRALPQFCVVGVKNIILFGWGLILGYPTILIPGLQNKGNNSITQTDFVLNDDQISWIGSINLLCVPLGSLTSGVLMNPIGKRRMMQLLNLPMLAAWALFYFANDIKQVYIGLCLSGSAGGLLEAPLNIYIAEAVQPQFRGMLTAFGTGVVLSGVCFQFIVGSMLHWRTVAAISAIFPFVAFNAVFLVPETPYWLYFKNRVDDAKKSLQWLRGWVSFKAVEKEFKCIAYAVETVRTEKKNRGFEQGKFNKTLQPFLKRTFILPFILIISGFFFSNFSGMTPLQTYAFQILGSYRVPINEYYATIFLGGAQVIGCLVGTIFIRSCGKRGIVLASFVGCGLCFFAVATQSYFRQDSYQVAINSGLSKENGLFDLANNNDTLHVIREDALAQNLTLGKEMHVETSSIYRWIPLILLLSGSMFAHCGAKLFPWMLLGELYPIEVRSSAAGLSAACGYLIGFLSNISFVSMVDAFTLNGTFWIYSAVAAIGSIVMYFVLPETEHRTLEEIQAIFDKSKRNQVTEIDTKCDESNNSQVHERP